LDRNFDKIPIWRLTVLQGEGICEIQKGGCGSDVALSQHVLSFLFVQSYPNIIYWHLQLVVLAVADWLMID